MLDEAQEPCLIVIKSGSKTGVTIGRATGVYSYVRTLTNEVSKEWAIIKYDKNSPDFSDTGDSGSLVVDGCGRIGGMITGGSGPEDGPIDITYATPMWWLWPRIKRRFPNANLYPTTAL
jgi:hypothetical protein